MAAFTKVNAFVEDLAKGKHTLDTSGNSGDQLKVALFASDPTASATTYTTLAAISGNELGTANGYTATGANCTVSASAQTGGTYKLTIDPDPVFTASGGDLGGSGDAFRYVVLYNSTDSTKPIIGYYDYGSNLTISDGNTFTVDFDASAGVLTIA